MSRGSQRDSRKEDSRDRWLRYVALAMMSAP
jgi:hypothetical protein